MRFAHSHVSLKHNSNCLVFFKVAHGASWTPNYELHATTDSGKPSSSVALHYRASISQTTGEDWSDVALTLSTASMDNADQRVPDIQALRIRPPAPEIRVRSIPRPSRGLRSRGAIRTAVSPPFGSSNDVRSYPEDWDEDEVEEVEIDGNPEGDLVTPGTVINESPLSLSYTVEGRSSIPTDGVAHKVSVAELNFEAKVMHVAVPRVRAQAYLQVRPLVSIKSLCRVANVVIYRRKWLTKVNIGCCPAQSRFS